MILHELSDIQESVMKDTSINMAAKEEDFVYITTKRKNPSEEKPCVCKSRVVILTMDDQCVDLSRWSEPIHNHLLRFGNQKEVEFSGFRC